MLEREFMKKWVEQRLAAEKKAGFAGGYWLRIPDSADGIKPFDGVFWLANGCAIAIEFKVWRYAGPFDGSTVEPHQMRALLEFQKGENRAAWIVVYYERTKKVRKFYPSQKALVKKLMEKK
jgi:hypothetical protein